MKDCDEIKKEVEKDLGKIREDAEKYQIALEKAKDALFAALEKARTMDVDSNWEKDDQRAAIINLDLKDVFAQQVAIKELLTSVDVEGKHSKNIAKSLEKYFDLNQKAVNTDEKAEAAANKKGKAYDGMTPTCIAEHLVELEEIFGDNEVVFLEKDRKALLGLIEKIKEEQTAIDAVETERTAKLDEAAKKYWTTNYISVIESIYAKNDPVVSEEEKTAIDGIFEECERGKEIAAKQEKIFVEYDKEYDREMNKEAAARFEEMPKTQTEEPEQEPVEQQTESAEEAQELVEESQGQVCEETQEIVEESQGQVCEETQETVEESQDTEESEEETTEESEEKTEEKTEESNPYETEPDDLAETATGESNDEE